MFKSKESTPQYTSVADPYKSIREPTIDWLKSQIGKPADQYQGEMVAPATDQEKQSLDFLKGYVDQGDSENTKLANEEVRKTMTDQYDPTSSGYYQAVKAESAKNLADVQENISDQAAGGGRYWGGARLKEQGTASNDAAIAMNKLLYGMQETERGRRLATAPLAAQLGERAEQKPLEKATALQSLGSLERTLSQARDEAIYNEWLRATQEYPLQVASMGAGLAREPYYAQTVKLPSAAMTMLNKMTTGPGSMFN
jgi:hypothetical protein